MGTLQKYTPEKGKNYKNTLLKKGKIEKNTPLKINGK